MTADMTEAACRGMHWIFDSTDLRDHLVARDICSRCPVLRDCAILLRQIQDDTAPAMKKAGGGPSGTWAGKLVGKGGGEREWGKRDPDDDGRICKAKPREHGTDRGYYQHRYYGEEKCEPCLAAHAESQRARSKDGSAA